MEVGQSYEISDNEAVYIAEVETARKQHVVFRILQKLPPEPPLVPVSLYVALIKFERLEVIVEKATELGVSDIHLVETERSERGLERAAPKRMARWERIALEASQQSRRTGLPILHEPVQFHQALTASAAYRLLLDENRMGQSILDVVPGPAHIAVLTGPEGGWHDSERKQARDEGWVSVSLGPLVLRTETAAVATLSTLNSIFARKVPPRPDYNQNNGLS